MTTTVDNPERRVVLKRALASDDQSVRFNAGLDLVKLKDVDGMPALIEGFEHDSPVVRLFHASRALVELGEAAVPALTAALEASNSRVRVDAAITLYKIDPARLDGLLPVAMEALRSDDSETVRDALHFLGEIGPAARAAVPGLIETLRAPQTLEDAEAWGTDTRVMVAALLAKIGEPLDTIIAALIEALHNEAASVRWGAARALGELGGAPKVAVPDLMAIVRDESEVETVRVEAAYSLAVLGDPATETVPVLLQALHSADWWVRAFAAYMLGELGSRAGADKEDRHLNWLDRSFFAPRDMQRVADPGHAVVSALAEALADIDYNVRRNAAYALSCIGERAADAIPALIEALRAPDTGAVAAEALAKVGDAAIRALTDTLAERDEVVRRHAAYALKLIGTPAAIDAIDAAERERPIDHLKPAPHHFYVQAPVVWDDSKVAVFEALYQATLAQGVGSEVAYTLPYPKHEFLRYCVEHKGLLLHGSTRTDLDVLKPLRWSTDGADHGNVSGVYADKDYIRPIYFGVVNRKRCFGLNNGFFDLTEDGQVSQDESQGFDRRFYRLTVGVNGLRRDPWQNAMVYILPPDTFEFWNEWTSRVPVRPLMKLAVAPEDLPLRDQVWGANWRQRGDLWVTLEDQFPFLKDVRGTPIRPNGRAPWG